MYMDLDMEMQQRIKRRLESVRDHPTDDAFVGNIDYGELASKIASQVLDGIDDRQLDELMAEQCTALSSTHLDYSILANRIVISSHHQLTLPHSAFVPTMTLLHTHELITLPFWQFVVEHEQTLESFIDYRRDYLIDYFGFKTLERSYLFCIPTSPYPTERPQHMWMRVAVFIHFTTPSMSLADILRHIRETYDFLSQKYYTHATPTLFNAATSRPQLSSCFLLAMESDSIDGIFNTLKDCSLISKWAGGIGLHVHNIRAKGSRIQGTNGTSNGLVPMLRVFNNAARYVDQGGGKRSGSWAIYLEPWHADILSFLDLKKTHGDEELKARDLFYALWIPDLFMERVKEPDGQGKWSLLCPHQCPGLSHVHGSEFRALYEQYESQPDKVKQVVLARDVWFAILDTQMETGIPYLCYKDTVNAKSNQQNLGTIESSNLCAEICQFSDSNSETAVCNLASIGLPSFVHETTKELDYDLLHTVAKRVTYNLNRLIDVNYYPIAKAETSNRRHRPIGLGVQGFADALVLMDIAFHSEKARQVNRLIFETIYHGAVEQSLELAQMTGVGPYDSFRGSPASQGLLQFDLWNHAVDNQRYDWSSLKQSIGQAGLRNSLLTALMPTASTSQILGFNECFEPFTSNLYTRRTLAGEFVVVNKYLMRELTALGVWNETVKNSIVAHRGSVQQLTFLSEHVRNKYKIVWEIPMKQVIDLAADRGPFICQSQSLNLWMEDPAYSKLTSMHFYAWERGLKTGMYYLRRKAKHQPQQFTIEPPVPIHIGGDQGQEEGAVCEMCSA